MQPDLKELIVQLKKYNPTFSDTDIRSHLINMGHSPELVDTAFGKAPAQTVVHGAFAPQGGPQPISQSQTIPVGFAGLGQSASLSPKQPPFNQNGEPFKAEGPLDPASEVKFFNEKVIGQRTVLPSGKIVAPHKSHFGRIVFFLFLLVFGGVGYCFYAGIIPLSSVTNHPLYISAHNSVVDVWSKFVTQKEVVPTETPLDQNTNTLPPQQNNNQIATSSKETTTPPVDEVNKIEEQINRVTRVRSALNIYAAFFGSYPETLDTLLHIESSNPQNKQQLPSLDTKDINDVYTDQKFIYKKDPKSGFVLTYVIDIPQGVAMNTLLYSVLDFRVAYNAKTKKYYSVPVIRVVNGTNTATRDVLSLELAKLKITDTNKNLIPDMYESLSATPH